MPEERLTLFIDYRTPRGMRAIDCVRALVAGALGGRCRLEVVDVIDSPERAESERIVTTPTLVRSHAGKRRLVVGDMTRPETVLSGLALEGLDLQVEQLGVLTELMATFQWSGDAGHRLDAWVDRVAELVRPPKGREIVREYLLGLLRPGGSKSAKRMAHRGDPETRSARYQAMHHMVARAPWSDLDLMARSRDRVLSAHCAEHNVAAWVIGERRIPRGGRSAVGLAPAPPTGPGRSTDEDSEAMHQRAVTLACVAADGEAAPAGFRLFLPPSWCEHPARRQRAGIPPGIRHLEPWAIAVELLDATLADQNSSAPRAPVCAAGDFVAAAAPDLAAALRARGLGYALQALPACLVTPAEEADLGIGAIPAHEVARRAGGRGVIPLIDEEARLGEDGQRPCLAVMAGPDGDPSYWLVGGPGSDDPDLLSEMPGHAASMFDDIATRAGLDAYNGRGWVGFHHHAALCVAAYAFLVSEDLEN